MGPKDLHTLADELAKGRTPAKLRCAVGRAYYAAFHSAASLLRECGHTVVANANAHGDIMNCLGGTPRQELKEISSKISGLRGSRNAADYDLTNPKFENPKNVQVAVTTAERVLQALETWRQEPKKSELKLLLAQYRQAIAGVRPVN